MYDCFVRTNGIDLHFVDHGGTGPTLVLLHGLTANARFFDALVEDGLGASFRVVAADLRGRGLSEKPATGYSIPAHVADVVGLIDELGIGTALVCGHSFGGLVTFALAAQHPDRVDRCVVLDAPAELDATVAEQIKPSLARLDATVPSFAEYLEAVRAQPYYGGWWDPRIEAYFRADVEDLDGGAVRPRSAAAAIAQAVEAAVDEDWLAVMSGVRAPTLFVRATGPYGPPGSPPICTDDAAARTVAAVADATLVEVDGNHMTAFFGEGARPVAEHITTFLLEGS